MMARRCNRKEMEGIIMMMVGPNDDGHEEFIPFPYLF